MKKYAIATKFTSAITTIVVTPEVILVYLIFKIYLYRMIICLNIIKISEELIVKMIAIMIYLSLIIYIH